MSDPGAPGFPVPPPPPPPPPAPPPPPPPPSMMAPPPGYVAYGAPEATGGVFKPIGTLSKAIVVLQVIALVLSALSLGLQAALRGPAQDYLAGTIDRQALIDDAAAYTAVSGLSSAVRIAAFVLLVIWSYRIAGNLLRLGRQNLTWKPGLTILNWVLHSCTLSIITVFMLQEHWRGSDASRPPGDPQWRQGERSTPITIWFALSISAIVMQLVQAAMLSSGTMIGFDLDEANAKVLAESVGNHLPIVVIAGLLALASRAALIAVVRQLSARHQAATREA